MPDTAHRGTQRFAWTVGGEMTMVTGAAMRFCPACATLTVAAFCPVDGVATFARKKVLPTAANMNVGDVVAGKFRVQRILGVGGFGAVYEAEHTGGLGRVALKMLSPTDHEEGDIRRFYREAQVTAALRHPNTVRVFDVGQHETGALYLAMELVHGHSLEEELRARKDVNEAMSEAETLEIGIDALRSLSEAHGRGLVHRDLKPANLMLTDVDGERVVKVLDFGIALVKGSSLTGSGHALGTPAYMSPEQCSGGEVDGRSDLYALGVVLYRCVTGQPPFHDTNPLAIMMSHVTGAPPPIQPLLTQPVSQGLIDIIETAMAKTSAERFIDARAMRAALEAVQKSQPKLSGEAERKGGWNFRYRPQADDGAIERTVIGNAITPDGNAAAESADTEAALPVSNGALSAATRVALRRETAATPSSRASVYTDFVDVATAQPAASGFGLDVARKWQRWAAATAVVVAALVWYAASRPPAAQVHAKKAAAHAAKPKPAPVVAAPPAPVAPPVVALAAAVTEVAAPLAPTPSEQARSQPVTAPAVPDPAPAATVEPTAKRGKHPASRHGRRRGARGDDDLSLPE
jgi:serine/threonine protein kinase